MPGFGRKKKKKQPQPELEPEPEPAPPVQTLPPQAQDSGAPPAQAAFVPMAQHDVAPSDVSMAVLGNDLLSTQLDGGQSIDRTTEDEDAQDLMDAVTECDVGKLEACLDKARDLDAAINEPFEDGSTLLWLACQLGHKDIVDRLIAAGADVDGVAFDESTHCKPHRLLSERIRLATALHAATEYGHAPCVEALLDARALTDRANEEGDTPLMVAATVHAHDCVQLLLSRGAGTDFVNDAGMTALDVARDCGKREGCTLELEEIVQALEIATQSDSLPETGRGSGFDTDTPHTSTFAGSKHKHWRIARNAAIAVGRMQRTVIFVVSSQRGRHAIEILGVRETTLTQLKQKIEAVLDIPVEQQELSVKGELISVVQTSATLSQLRIDAMAEVVVRDCRLDRVQDVDEAAAQYSGVESSNASASNFHSAETAALRAQVQHLQKQLECASQDKAAHAAATARSEQQVHVLQRARKAELAAKVSLPSLPVSTYQEQPPQKRGPPPQEPWVVKSKGVSIAADSASHAKSSTDREGAYGRRYPPSRDLLASASTGEALRRVNGHIHTQTDRSVGLQIVSVVPGDSSCTIVFQGVDEMNTRAYMINAQPVTAPDASHRHRRCCTVVVVEPQLQRSVTIENLENFVEVLITVAALSITGGEKLVACLGTPLPRIPAIPTIRAVRTTSTSIDLSVHIPDPGGAPLTSLTARIQRSTETRQRVAAVIPATADTTYRISIPGLASGARFAVAVSASNAGGEGEQVVFWASTSPALPGAVTPISVTAADSSVEFLFTLDDDAAAVSHVTILTQEPGEAEPRVATVLPCTQDMRRSDPVRVCVAGLANWVRTEVFVVAGNRNGDGPACRFSCTPQPHQVSSASEQAASRQAMVSRQ